MVTRPKAGEVQVWSVPGQRFQFTFSGHSNWVRSCCFSPDGRLAVSGSDDKTVRIWDVATRQCLRVYDDHSGYVNTVAFHPDGTCVASAGTDNAIKVGLALLAGVTITSIVSKDWSNLLDPDLLDSMDLD